jgi:hypothetical protein
MRSVQLNQLRIEDDRCRFKVKCRPRLAAGHSANTQPKPAEDLLEFVQGRKFGTILADPPWRFENRTGKVAPEHKRLSRYGTMTFDEIGALPITELAAPVSHLYLWCPNALLPQGIAVVQAWGVSIQKQHCLAQGP